VAVINSGDRGIAVWVDSLKHTIEISLAHSDQPYRIYVDPTAPLLKVWPATEPLAPGQSKRYAFRILGTFHWKETPQRRSHLACDKPGHYRVMARYPVPESDGKQIESNTVQFRVRAPQGTDAKVWERINDPELLFFLQTAQIRGGHLEVLDKLVETYHEAPESGYRPAIRWALEQYFRKPRKAIGAEDIARRDAERERIRQAPGLPKEGLFPDDNRLDTKVSYHFAQFTPFEEVFRAISAQSGVPLHVSPELAGRAMSSARLTRSVREFMSQFENDAVWVFDGAGYILTRSRDPKAK
jgi:hypothetical protein